MSVNFTADTGIKITENSEFILMTKGQVNIIFTLNYEIITFNGMFNTDKTKIITSKKFVHAGIISLMNFLDIVIKRMINPNDYSFMRKKDSTIEFSFIYEHRPESEWDENLSFSTYKNGNEKCGSIPAHKNNYPANCNKLGYNIIVIKIKINNIITRVLFNMEEIDRINKFMNLYPTIFKQ